MTILYGSERMNEYESVRESEVDVMVIWGNLVEELMHAREFGLKFIFFTLKIWVIRHDDDKEEILRKWFSISGVSKGIEKVFSLHKNIHTSTVWEIADSEIFYVTQRNFTRYYSVHKNKINILRSFSLFRGERKNDFRWSISIVKFLTSFLNSKKFLIYEFTQSFPSHVLSIWLSVWRLAKNCCCLSLSSNPILMWFHCEYIWHFYVNCSPLTVFERF